MPDPSTEPRLAPHADYGHFDAAAWEIEIGHKESALAEFVRFPNLTEAFRCHALLLATKPRFAPAMQILRGALGGFRRAGAGAANIEPRVCYPAGPAKAETRAPGPAAEVPIWQQFAERLGPQTSPLDLERCGYSTCPNYSAELTKLVHRYRLNDPRALQWFATGRDPGPLGLGGDEL